MESGLEGGGDGVFGDGETVDAGREARPFGTLEGQEKFVDVVEAIFAADEGGFDFLGDGESAEDVSDGLIEKCVGDGEQAHEEKVGFLVVQVHDVGKFLAEVGARERSADEFGRLTGSESDDRENGDPAAEFAFTEKSEGVADAVHFGPQAEERGVEVAKQTIEKGRLVFEEFFDGGVIEFDGGDEIEEAELQEFVAGDFAGFDHGGLAEEIALEIGVAKTAGFGEFGFGFDFFGEE